MGSPGSGPKLQRSRASFALGQVKTVFKTSCRVILINPVSGSTLPPPGTLMRAFPPLFSQLIGCSFAWLGFTSPLLPVLLFGF